MTKSDKDILIQATVIVWTMNAYACFYLFYLNLIQ